MKPKYHHRKIKSKKFIQAYPARDISGLDVEEYNCLTKKKQYRQLLYISMVHNHCTGVVCMIENQIYKATETFIVALLYGRGD